MGKSRIVAVLLMNLCPMLFVSSAFSAQFGNDIKGLKEQINHSSLDENSKRLALKFVDSISINGEKNTRDLGKKLDAYIGNKSLENLIALHSLVMGDESLKAQRQAFFNSQATRVSNADDAIRVLTHYLKIPGAQKAQREDSPSGRMGNFFIGSDLRVAFQFPSDTARQEWNKVHENLIENFNKLASETSKDATRTSRTSLKMSRIMNLQLLLNPESGLTVKEQQSKFIYDRFVEELKTGKSPNLALYAKMEAFITDIRI